eukprot:GHVP01015715.1.p2 GENE.GHVP01015715.1~~GHVP01015715.1.p2  ORF type:complete len:691 (+),score=157.92 GHVP01015715.1:2044-4116(+)
MGSKFEPAVKPFSGGFSSTGFSDSYDETQQNSGIDSPKGFSQGFSPQNSSREPTQLPNFSMSGFSDALPSSPTSAISRQPSFSSQPSFSPSSQNYSQGDSLSQNDPLVKLDHLIQHRKCLHCKKEKSNPQTNICSKCHPILNSQTCRHCGDGFKSFRFLEKFNGEVGRHVCLTCARKLRIHQGLPRNCLHCKCWSAFGGFNSCDRCRESLELYKEPVECEKCGCNAAFRREPEKMAKVDNRLLCFRCTTEYKKTRKSDKKPKSSSTNDPDKLAIELLKTENQKLKAALESKTEELQDLRESSHFELFKQQQENEDLKRKKIKEGQKAISADQQIHFIQSSHAKILEELKEEHSKELSSLYDTLARVKEGAEQTEKKYTAADKKIKELKHRLKTAEMSSGMEEELMKARRTIDNNKDKMNKYQKDCADFKDKMIDLQDRVEQLDSQKRSLQRQLRDYRRKSSESGNKNFSESDSDESQGKPTKRLRQNRQESDSEDTNDADNSRRRKRTLVPGGKQGTNKEEKKIRPANEENMTSPTIADYDTSDSRISKEADDKDLTSNLADLESYSAQSLTDIRESSAAENNPVSDEQQNQDNFPKNFQNPVSECKQEEPKDEPKPEDQKQYEFMQDESKIEDQKQDELMQDELMQDDSKLEDQKQDDVMQEESKLENQKPNDLMQEESKLEDQKHDDQ